MLETAIKKESIEEKVTRKIYEQIEASGQSINDLSHNLLDSFLNYYLFSDDYEELDKDSQRDIAESVFTLQKILNVLQEHSNTINSVS